jgi:8-oxo-dGTP pyrophosphatase MutT (NUDIX family)
MWNREAARLLLLDDGNRVLLVQFENGRGVRWWAAPGGGVESGETIEQALAREAKEELGLADVGAAQFTFEREVIFENLQGATIRQHEHFFVDRCRSHEVPAEQLVHLRNEGVVAVRWWTADELRDTDELVFPEGLVELLRTLDEADP